MACRRCNHDVNTVSVTCWWSHDCDPTTNQLLLTTNSLKVYSVRNHTMTEQPWQSTAISVCQCPSNCVIRRTWGQNCDADLITSARTPGINQYQKGGVETEALLTCVIMLSICSWIFYRNLCSFKYLFYVLYFYMGLVLCKYSRLHVVVLPAVSSSSWPPLSGRVFKAASCFQWVLVCATVCYLLNVHK